MSKHHPPSGCSPNQSAIEVAHQNVLVVADLIRWQDQGRTLPVSQNLRFIDFAELTAELVAQFSPDIILSPLVETTFDVVDVACLLAQMGYEGPYRAVSDALPNARAVSLEIRTSAPSVDFDIVDWAQVRGLDRSV